MKKTLNQSVRRANKVRGRIKQGGARRKISVFRSNRFIWSQIVDLVQGTTLVAFSSKSLKKKKEYKSKKLNKCQEAFEVGRMLAQLALDKGVKKVVFDRGCYAYHGRVKALAEGARKGGLKF